MVVITEVTDDMALVPNANDFVVQRDFRGRTVNSLGIQNFKGGQAIDASLIDSVKASYANLVYHPFALFALVLGSFILVAESTDSSGPLEMLCSVLHRTASNSSIPFVQQVIILVLQPFELLIIYKRFVALLCLVLFSWIAKPSMRNLFYSFGMLVVVLIGNFTILEVFILCNFFYLFVMIRNTSYKFIIVVVIIAMTLGFFEVNTVLQKLKTTHSNLNVNVQHNPTAPPPVTATTPPPPTQRPFRTSTAIPATTVI